MAQRPFIPFFPWKSSENLAGMISVKCILEFDVKDVTANLVVVPVFLRANERKGVRSRGGCGSEGLGVALSSEFLPIRRSVRSRKLPSDTALDVGSSSQSRWLVIKMNCVHSSSSLFTLPFILRNQYELKGYV